MGLTTLDTYFSTIYHSLTSVQIFNIINSLNILDLRAYYVRSSSKQVSSRYINIFANNAAQQKRIYGANDAEY